MKATMPIVVLLASALQGQLYEVKKFGIPPGYSPSSPGFFSTKAVGINKNGAIAVNGIVKGKDIRTGQTIYITRRSVTTLTTPATLGKSLVLSAAPMRMQRRSTIRVSLWAIRTRITTALTEPLSVGSKRCWTMADQLPRRSSPWLSTFGGPLLATKLLLLASRPRKSASCTGRSTLGSFRCLTVLMWYVRRGSRTGTPSLAISRFITAIFGDCSSSLLTFPGVVLSRIESCLCKPMPEFRDWSAESA